MLRVVFIPEIEPLEKNQTCLETLRNTLSRGISVCIFVENPCLQTEIENLQNSPHVSEVFDGTHYPIVPVSIEKGIKTPAQSLVAAIFHKLRLPASVSFAPNIQPSLKAPTEIC